MMLTLLALISVVALNPPPNEMAVAQRAMQGADHDHDGSLSFAEYRPLDVQAAHHGEEHFQAGDANHDGLLSLAELAVTLHKQTWFAVLSEGTETCFTRLDADKNRKLDSTEYRKISRMGGHAEPHFKHADTDGDGFLSLAEFAAHAEAKIETPGEPPQREALTDGKFKRGNSNGKFKGVRTH